MDFAWERWEKLLEANNETNSIKMGSLLGIRN